MEKIALSTRTLICGNRQQYLSATQPVRLLHNQARISLKFAKNPPRNNQKIRNLKLTLIKHNFRRKVKGRHEAILTLKACLQASYP